MSTTAIPSAEDRQTPPEPPAGEILLQAPPALPRGSGSQGLTQLMFTLPMMLGMGAMSFVSMDRGGGGGVTTYLFGALFGCSTIGMIVMSLTRGGAAKKAQINKERRDYQRYLASLRQRVREVAALQRTALLAVRPRPDDLWSVVEQGKAWQRHHSDQNFGHARVGTAAQLLATPLRAPQTAPLEDLDPVSSAALRQFIKTYGSVADLPVAIALRSFPFLSVSGERAVTQALARALIAQLATFQSPDDLKVALCVAADRRSAWEWLKWFPHCQATPSAAAGSVDATGPGCLVADNLTALAALLGTDLGDRPAFRKDGGTADRAHILVIMDGGRAGGDTALAPSGGRQGVTVLDVTHAQPSAMVGPNARQLHVTGDRMGTLVGEGRDQHMEYLCRPDALDAASAETLGRMLAGSYRSAPAVTASPMTASLDLPELLGIGDPRELDPALTWRLRAARERLRIPIGIGPQGEPVELDLKESAESGMGPHGLVIGATGSGKSELLRTLVTGLAVTHSSEALNLALVDFKGGATFAGMTELPHTCAVITNLSDDLTLVDRMADAIQGEVVRRQEMLRAAGNYASVRDYERARANGAELAPLPSLLVIIDEFSELLSARPEFIDLFVMIGRLGRSLAIHLMLASQRLEEGRLRGLDAHLSYRIGLRTFSASESRAVLGVPDAYHLPPTPGSGYLKIDTETLLRFKAAYVSGAIPSRRRERTASRARSAVLPFTLAPISDDSGVLAASTGKHAAAPGAAAMAEPAESMAVPAAAAGESIMETLVSRLVGKGPAAHQIWLPPLDEPPTLEQLLPALSTDPQRGLCPAGWNGSGKLTVPVAIVDKPFEQRRDVLRADLSGAAGHVIVIGGPQSGKSTLSRTLISALALTHTPEEVQFMVLDMGGGALGPVSGLPHVSGYATRRDGERVRRVVAELVTLLAEREQSFAEAGIESIAAFRVRRAELTARAADGRPFGDVFLVVDGWETLRQEYEHLEEPVTALAARGLGFGIHVILTTNRVMAVRQALRDTIGTRFELRIGDPADSVIDRRVAANVPQGTPGRGVSPDKLHFLGALPRLDGDPSAATMGAGTADLVQRIDTAWPGARAPQVRLLPREVSLAALRRLDQEQQLAPGKAQLVPLGISEDDLRPVHIDFDADPHFIAFGDVESGKSGLLRTIAAGVIAAHSPERAAILVVDYRRALLDTVPAEHLLGYAGSETALTALVNDCAEAMRRRMPGPEVTGEQLRNRSWWTGPELFVLVDDYELVAVSGRNPLAPLLGYLPQSRDIGLHLVVARASGGAARGLYDPILQRMRELGSPGIVMSGSRDEGVLLGTVKPGLQPPGRGTLVRRRSAPLLVQVAWTPPVHG
jgi:DNA segregation ATPase FtsK/SpoIIIE, S-DNA-T family